MPSHETMPRQITHDNNDNRTEDGPVVIEGKAVEILDAEAATENEPGVAEAVSETPEPEVDPEVANGIKVLENQLSEEVARIEGHIDHVTMNKYLDVEGQGKYVLAANAYLFAIRDLREAMNKGWEDQGEMERVLQMKSDTVIEEQRKFAEIANELLEHVETPVEAREAPLQITYEPPPGLLEQLAALLAAAAGASKKTYSGAKSFRDRVVNYFDTGVPSDKSGAGLKGSGGNFWGFMSKMWPWGGAK